MKVAHGTNPLASALREMDIWTFCNGLDNKAVHGTNTPANELDLERTTLASNLVSVQLGCLRHNGGVGIVHDFILPSAPDIERVLADDVSFTRSFYLLRHADDARVERLEHVSQALIRGIRAEIARLEALT